MNIRIFDPPEEGKPTFRAVGLVTQAAEITLTERFWSPGCFSLTLPAGARHGDKLEPGRLLRFDGGFWGIADALTIRADEQGEWLTLSGRQLKGLTMDRITIPPGSTQVVGAQGYDPVNGSTETCMKHYVSANLGGEAPPGRRVFGLVVARDLGRGVAEDRYISRHEVLSDVLEALGQAAGLGYDIVPDLDTQALIFDVSAGEDHTAGQRERKRVIFDVGRKTALAQQYDHSQTDSRNVFYATMAGSEFADEALTVTYLRAGEEEPVGIRRRERHLELSADTPTAGEEYGELERLALIEAEGFRPARSMTVQVAQGPYRYGVDYRVGDLVTVRCAHWGITMDARLTEMESSFTQEGVTRSATFGDAPLTVLGRLKKQMKRGI